MHTKRPLVEQTDLARQQQQALALPQPSDMDEGMTLGVVDRRTGEVDAHLVEEEGSK